MKTIVKKEECKKCNGSGTIFLTTNAAGIKMSILDDDAKYKNCDYCGSYDKVGTGRLKNTYEVISDTVCDECYGEKKARYMKPGFNPSHTLFGNVTDKEQEQWNKKYTVLKECIKCYGTGKKLKLIDSKPIKKGWF